MSTTISNLISNNVKGICSITVLFFSKKHTHSDKMKKKQKDDFKNPLFFSHGSTNSCGVAYIGFCI